MTLSSRINAAISIIQTAAPDGGQARVDQALSIAKEIANGTTNDKADLAFIDTRTLSSNSSEDLDLAGSLADALGNTLTMVECTTILIENPSTNTTDLTIGGATAEAQLFFAAAGDKVVIKPGGFFMAHNPAGWTIGAGSTDDVRIANASGAANTFNIAALGRSA